MGQRFRPAAVRSSRCTGCGERLPRRDRVPPPTFCARRAPRRVDRAVPPSSRPAPPSIRPPCPPVPAARPETRPPADSAAQFDPSSLRPRQRRAELPSNDTRAIAAPESPIDFFLELFLKAGPEGERSRTPARAPASRVPRGVAGREAQHPGPPASDGEGSRGSRRALALQGPRCTPTISSAVADGAAQGSAPWFRELRRRPSCHCPWPKWPSIASRRSRAASPLSLTMRRRRPSSRPAPGRRLPSPLLLIIGGRPMRDGLFPVPRHSRSA